MHEECKALSYVAVMVDLLTGSNETLSKQELVDLRNLVWVKASDLLNKMDEVIGEDNVIIS